MWEDRDDFNQKKKLIMTIVMTMIVMMMRQWLVVGGQVSAMRPAIPLCTTQTFKMEINKIYYNMFLKKDVSSQ